MSHLGIVKVHKILTLQQISGEMLVRVEEKTNKSTLVRSVSGGGGGGGGGGSGCYGGTRTIEEL